MLFRRATALIAGLAFISLAHIGYSLEKSQVVYPKKDASAEQTETSNASMDDILAEGGSAGGMIVTILGYTVILGALGAAGWVLFKRGIIRKTFKGGEGKLKIAESRMLGNRQFLMVVEYDQQKILLGVGPGKIDYLTTLQSAAGEIAPFDAQLVRQGGLDQ